MLNNKFKNDRRSLKKRVIKIITELERLYPVIGVRLTHESPFELLAATILSAQCTDERVNKVTEKLFMKYHSPEDFINAAISELERDIFSTGYYKAKAKKIKGAMKMLVEKYKGIVPSTMEELLELPGVGRKTANVILNHCFNIPGVVVDTHVARISNRLGLADTDNPKKIEFALMEIVPKEHWNMLTHYMIDHGRAICVSRKPRCRKCT
ncbi:MAG: endonuclease, partial [Bacteroidota bacterium]|nr:endonuclease [Bacteroidota bacterium]